MIIKSMSRKEASFGQLIDYITDEGKAERRYFYGHNTFTNDPEAALKAIEENASLLKQRKNGNYMYHEVISFTKEQGVDEIVLKEALRDTAIRYLDRRAKNNLAFAAIHDDHEGHLHCHLMISANEAGESRRYRLSTAKFSAIKTESEQYVLQTYPEIKQTLIIGQSKELAKQKSDKETQVKKRGKTSKVEQLSEAVEYVLSRVGNEEEFAAQLEQMGLKFYRRGKTAGIIDTQDDRKYRFKRLGIETAYQDMLNGRNFDSNEMTAKDHAKEWVFGDFSKRESLSARQKEQEEFMKRQHPEDDDDELTLGDKIKEWTHGDFSAREEIARRQSEQQESEKLDEYLKEGKEDLTTKEIMDEWVKGDFSARERKEKAERIKEWTEQRQQDEKEKVIQERMKQMEKILAEKEEQEDQDEDSHGMKRGIREIVISTVRKVYRALKAIGQNYLTRTTDEVTDKKNAMASQLDLESFHSADAAFLELADQAEGEGDKKGGRIR